MFKVEIYDIPAGKIDVEALVDAVGVSSEDVKSEAEDLRGGRPGVQITCRGDAELDTERLAEKVEDYLAEGE